MGLLFKGHLREFLLDFHGRGGGHDSEKEQNEERKAEITSPISRASPTYTISSMAKLSVARTVTTGPLME